MADDETDIGLDPGTEGEDAGFDGLSQATAAELAAQEAEDQEGQAESQEEELDLNQPYFAYTDEKGEELELTGQQILELIESQKAEKPAEEKSAAAEVKPAEAKTGEETPEVEPVHWDQVGNNFAELLENNPADIGPQLKDLNIRMILTDPHIRGAIQHVLREEMGQVETAKTTISKLTEDLGSDVNQFVQSGEYGKFRQANPVYAAATPTEALALSVIMNLKGEIAQLKSGSKKEVEAAKKAGEAATIKQLKARGTLRPLRGSGYRRPSGGQPKLDPTDPEQRSQGMMNTIVRMREGKAG
jgi:hypothetical protein